MVRPFGEVMPLSMISVTRFTRQTASRGATDEAVHSASVVDEAMVVCILDAQMIGHAAQAITHPVRDGHEVASSASASECDPAQSASTQHSKPFSMSGSRMMPLS